MPFQNISEMELETQHLLGERKKIQSSSDNWIIRVIMDDKIVICPVCGKKTWLRIQNSNYLKDYPIRVNCYNCKGLLKGIYVMISDSNSKGLTMFNAAIEECDMKVGSFMNIQMVNCNNADYYAEISGELPCAYVKEYKGDIPQTPFIKATEFLGSVEKYKERLSSYSDDLDYWKQKRSMAFQLFNDGSVDYISVALNNKLGDYIYDCNNSLKTLQCLHEVVLEESKYLFLNTKQDDVVKTVISSMADVNKDMIHQFLEHLGGIEELMSSYKKTVDVFCRFMSIYQNLLPAETYMNYKEKDQADKCISTCSFMDIKSFYQDAYESLLSVMYFPVCLDNIVLRGNYQVFSEEYNDVRCPENSNRDFDWYKGLENGIRRNKLNYDEHFQKLVDFPADRILRNGIGHNNYVYDSINQTVTVFVNRKCDRTKEFSLMDIGVVCLELAKCSVILAEIIMFLFRFEYRQQGVHSIIHPRFYKGVQPNDKCPCGSTLKYKKCCKNDVESILKNKLS